MPKSIVPSLTTQELMDLFRKEAKIEQSGMVDFSVRGIARLVGKDKTTITNLLQNIARGKKTI
jgi:hypothetical protein